MECKGNGAWQKGKGSLGAPEGWRDPRDAGSDTCPLLLHSQPSLQGMPHPTPTFPVRAGYEEHPQLSGKTWPKKPAVNPVSQQGQGAAVPVLLRRTPLTLLFFH